VERSIAAFGFEGEGCQLSVHVSVAKFQELRLDTCLLMSELLATRFGHAARVSVGMNFRL